MLRLCVAFLWAAVCVSAAGPANLSGNWQLNVAKTDWGARPKLVSVALHIDHSEPALKYSGTVIYSGEDARPFSFAGAIDGKEYPMDRSFGSGKVVIRRVDANTIESVFRSADGLSVETCRTSLAKNGRTLTRRVRMQTVGSTFTSTEIYDRR
jgi:hypothetical protein